MVEFFYNLAPPGFEPGTSCTLAERTTDVDTKTERFLAQNLSVLVATSVVRSAKVREVPGSNPGRARV